MDGWMDGWMSELSNEERNGKENENIHAFPPDASICLPPS